MTDTNKCGVDLGVNATQRLFNRQLLTILLLTLTGGVNAAPPNPPAPMIFEGTPGGVRILEEGQPPAVIHPTREAMENYRASQAETRAKAPTGSATTTNNLSSRGGSVQTAPKVYLVFWGSQWNLSNANPSGEDVILQNLLAGVGGTSWLGSVTQYCQGVTSGTSSCSGVAISNLAGNQQNILSGVWWDTTSAAPNHPTQSNFATEAARAATHFGDKTANAHYLIATASGYNSSGFKTQYCAYHSYANTTAGKIAYTNLPYITDAGSSCGANFNGLGPKAGITMVAGHELAEVITDPFPSSGWLDSSGQENADKCSWISSGQGAAASVTLLNNVSYPMQSLWSNAFNSGAGGCVQFY